LEKDLYALDELVGLHAARDEKKREVVHIQGLIENLEHIKKSLSTLREHVKATNQAKEADLDKMAEEELEHLEQLQPQPPKAEKGKEQEGGRKSIPVQTRNSPAESKKRKRGELEKEALEKEENDGADEGSKMEVDEEDEKVELAAPLPDLASQWGRLRLDARFEVDEDAHGYTIRGDLPGMDKESIEMRVEPNRLLAIAGIRRPTVDELSQMRRLIRQRYSSASPQEEHDVRLTHPNGLLTRFVCCALTSFPSSSSVLEPGALVASWNAFEFRRLSTSTRSRPGSLSPVHRI